MTHCRAYNNFKEIIMDLQGQAFGRVTITAYHGYERGSHFWQYRCVCGGKGIARQELFRAGRKQSCGCLQKERAAEAKTKHGHCSRKRGESLTYRTWKSMMRRCHDEKQKQYHLWGGRGISVCVRWHVFSNFINDMGERKTKEHTLDRINPNGNYEPNNCRWATHIEQARNRRAGLHLVQIDGKNVCLKEACEIKSVSYDLIRSRIQKKKIGFWQAIKGASN